MSAKSAETRRAADGDDHPAVEMHGFKDSPLGKIPNDWDVKAFSEIVESAVDGPFGSNLKTEHYVDEPGVRVLRLQNVGNGEFIDTDKAWVSTEHARKLARHSVLSGDLLVGSLGDDKRLFGRACLYPDTPQPAIVKADVFRVRCRRDVMHHGFVFRLLNFPRWRRGLVGLAQGVTRDRVNLSNLMLLKLPVPSTNEQRKMAEILSTVDRAIEQTEALIAKQQRIKTGLMQDLLTRGIDERGNLRSEDTHQFKDSPLGRIPVEWTPSTLGEVGAWSSGGTPSKNNPQFWGGTVPWVSPKDMKNFDLSDTMDRITEAADRCGSRVMPAGTIFIVIRGMILAHTFPVCYATRPMAFNQDVKAITARKNVCSRFLAYWLTANGQTMLKIATTATHGTKRFDMDDLYAVDIALPEDTEQELTAKALDDVQKQVLVTMSELGKLQSLKTALMQDLLTGEKRVTLLLESAVTI